MPGRANAPRRRLCSPFLCDCALPARAPLVQALLPGEVECPAQAVREAGARHVIQNDQWGCAGPHRLCHSALRCAAAVSCTDRPCELHL